jgi:hypothetical protein
MLVRKAVPFLENIFSFRWKRFSRVDGVVMLDGNRRFSRCERCRIPYLWSYVKHFKMVPNCCGAVFLLPETENLQTLVGCRRPFRCSELWVDASRSDLSARL